MFNQWGRWGKASVQTFLKTLTEGAVTTEGGSLFQYFTTLTENAGPLLRWWLAPWSTLKGCSLRPGMDGNRLTTSNPCLNPAFDCVGVALNSRSCTNGRIVAPLSLDNLVEKYWNNFPASVVTFPFLNIFDCG